MADFWMVLAVKSCPVLATLPVTSLVEGQVFGPPWTTCPLHIKYGCPLKGLCHEMNNFFESPKSQIITGTFCTFADSF